jgi:hypothetical protein
MRDANFLHLQQIVQHLQPKEHILLEVLHPRNYDVYVLMYFRYLMWAYL